MNGGTSRAVHQWNGPSQKLVTPGPWNVWTTERGVSRSSEAWPLWGMDFINRVQAGSWFPEKRHRDKCS